MLNRRQTGVTMIELLIALTLALLIVTALINVFIGQKGTYNLVESMSRIQESGRFVLDFLTRDVRMAGRRDLSGAVTNATIAFPPFDASNTRTNADASQHGDSTIAGDRLTVAYFPVEGGPQEDCLGDGSGTTASDGSRLPVINTYFVDRASGTLRCLGKSSTAGIIAGNVDQLEVQYGIDTSGDSAADLYKSAAHLTSAEWGQVMAVRLSLLISSDNASPAYDPKLQRFKLLDATEIDGDTRFGDRRLRRQFTSTVMIRNLRGIAP